MEIGVYSFGEVDNSSAASAAQRLNDLLEEIELADQVGLDIFGVGEHHRVDFAVSVPAVVLAAAAARTKNIRLSSAVTVLSSDDPVRVFQEFATLDLISGGRAEIMAGRGSFIESFPLFGYDLQDYDELFAAKLDLLLQLRDHERVTWAGPHRAALDNIGVYPRPLQNPLPVWLAVGGTPQSVVRAATLGLPLASTVANSYEVRSLRGWRGRQGGHDGSGGLLGEPHAEPPAAHAACASPQCLPGATPVPSTLQAASLPLRAPAPTLAPPAQLVALL